MKYLIKNRDRVSQSLFGEILDWMLVPLIVLWPLSIAITYLAAKAIANQPFDRNLEDKWQVLAQQVQFVDGKAELELSPATIQMMGADGTDRFYFQVRAGEKVIAGEPELSVPIDDTNLGPKLTMRNIQYKGEEVRIASGNYILSFDKRVGNQEIYVQVGETLEKRGLLAKEIVKSVVLPQFIVLPIALTLVWFALSRGLSPLTQLTERINKRKPDDLSPIDNYHVPEEIRPLVEALNEMLRRLENNIATQKRFIADAAHQMKTPLAGMRTQAELALRQTSLEEIQTSLQQVARSSVAATRLVNQLLSMAKAENSATHVTEIDIDLNLLVREVVQDWVMHAMNIEIDLGFEDSDERVFIRGQPLLIREMLGNLIDNALHYAPKQSSVTVRIESEWDYAVIEVEDQGCGIPESERTRVFERFYRILGSDIQGSGLGLAIVKEIAQQHRAEIEITSNPRCRSSQFPGCVFKVIFPRFERTSMTLMG